MSCQLRYRKTVGGSGHVTACMKHLTNAEVGLRPVGAIVAYVPEGMWNAEGWSRCALSFLK
jgi:hypothetical protein